MKFTLHLSPTTAAFECRVDRIEVGREARKRLRQQLSCPECNKVHEPEAASLLAFVDDEAKALRELLNDEMERHASTRKKVAALRRRKVHGS